MKNERLSKVDSAFIIILSIILIISSIIISMSPTAKMVSPEQQFGIVKNITEELNERNEDEYQNESLVDNSSNQILAPFVDMASWVDTTSYYSINGVPSLKHFYEESGCSHYCLGFIRPDDNRPLESDGTIRWGWGGFYELSEKGNDGFQYEGIKKSIQQLRDAGGDVVVSVGGQLGKAPWKVTQDVSQLKKMYLEIVDAYNLKRLDLDIEEINQGYAENVANAKAIRRLQEERGTEIVLTIPIMPYGYTNTQKNLLRAYLGNGVSVKIINNMTMCFGNEVNPGEDFADASIRAIDNSCRQVKSIFAEYGLMLEDGDVYKMLGATVDIGYENQYNPIFTTDMTSRVAEYANSKDLAMFSYWCVNRDCMIQSNIAIKNKYEFYDASKKYLK